MCAHRIDNNDSNKFAFLNDDDDEMDEKENARGGLKSSKSNVKPMNFKLMKS